MYADSERISYVVIENIKILFMVNMHINNCFIKSYKVWDHATVLAIKEQG